MISLDYKDSKSLHEQIESGFKGLIISKVLSPNEQLPSVRELSVSLTVNPNTVQRAYKQLEAEGFIYSVKGKGSFVADVAQAKDSAHIKELYDSLISIVGELMYLGEEKRAVDNVITNVFTQKEGKA